MPSELAQAYRSAAQRARVVTEGWGQQNLYCPNCESENLAKCRPNAEAVDFTCPVCAAPFQLKSQSRPLAARVTDAAYSAMRRAVQAGSTPNLLVLHYDLAQWQVRNLLLVPRFAFSMSAIEKRKPLASSARRHGWVGCNIVLTSIPIEARIPVVADSVALDPATVRHQYNRLRPLSNLGYDARGWTLDVLKVVREIGTGEFDLDQVYGFEAELARLHPQNRHVREKIRQQLQVLRDMGLVNFVGRGRYRIA